MGLCLQTSGPGSDNLFKKKKSVGDIFGRDSDEIHSWNGFAKLKGQGIVLHKTTISAQDSDTSCKFGEPQGHPHFWPGDKFEGLYRFPPLWSFSQVMHGTQESAVFTITVLLQKKDLN